MSKTTNFIDSRTQRPLGQKRWFSVPAVKIFEGVDFMDLETQINVWIQAMATPVSEDFWYDIRDIKYSSAREANNTVSYSAMAIYDIWEPR